MDGWPASFVYRDYTQPFTPITENDIGDTYGIVFRLPSKMSGRVLVWGGDGSMDVYARSSDGIVYPILIDYTGGYDGTAEFVYDGYGEGFVEIGFFWGNDEFGMWGSPGIDNLVIEHGGVSEFWTAFKNCKELQA